MDEETKDCHKLAELDKWLGKRAIITTTKGVVRGRLQYMAGWYFCCAGERRVNNKWVQCPYKFLFRKTQFRKIESTPAEDGYGR